MSCSDIFGKAKNYFLLQLWYRSTFLEPIGTEQLIEERGEVVTDDLLSKLGDENRGLLSDFSEGTGLR